MKSILIIEDDENIAELERDYLELNGYKVEIVKDGAQGHKRAMSGVYDVIIVDLMLPNMDGYAITKAVREKFEIPIGRKKNYSLIYLLLTCIVKRVGLCFSIRPS